MDLNEIRRNIDKIDRNIVQLIAKRISLIPLIADYKRKNNILVYDPKREKELLDEKRKICGELGISKELVEDIFNMLIKESHKIEEKILGEKNERK